MFKTNKEAVIATLKEYNCQTAKSIACSAKRLFDYDMTPAQVSGALRPLMAKGYATNSKADGKTTYWLTDYFLKEVDGK